MKEMVSKIQALNFLSVSSAKQPSRRAGVLPPSSPVTPLQGTCRQHGGSHPGTEMASSPEIYHGNPQMCVCSWGRSSDALGIIWSVWEGDSSKDLRVSTSVCRYHHLSLSWLFGASDGTDEAEAQMSEVFFHGGSHTACRRAALEPAELPGPGVSGCASPGAAPAVLCPKMSVFPWDFPQILLSPSHATSSHQRDAPRIVKAPCTNPHGVCHKGKLFQEDRRYFSQYTRPGELRATKWQNITCSHTIPLPFWAWNLLHGWNQFRILWFCFTLIKRHPDISAQSKSAPERNEKHHFYLP